VILPTQGDLQAVTNFFNCTPGNTASCPIDAGTGNPIITNTNNLPMNAAGLALLKYYPCSDGAGGTVQCSLGAASGAVSPGGFTQTVFVPNTNTLPGSFIVKIDHKLNSKMTLWPHLYSDSEQSGPAPATRFPGTGQRFSPDGLRQVTRALWRRRLIYNISANKIPDVRFSWSRFSQILRKQCQSLTWGSTLVREPQRLWRAARFERRRETSEASWAIRSALAPRRPMM
jgi:hypothetical protein